MSEPLVSIVIPAFNGLPYIPDAYQSCLDQTYPNIEICIADGGSTDGTIDWIKALPASVRTDFLPAGSSAAENWTHATLMASGTYIKLLCQDDLLYPRAVEQQITDITSNPEISMAIAKRDVISASGKVIYQKRGLRGLTQGIHRSSTVLESVYLGGTNTLGEPHVILFHREALLRTMPWKSQRSYLLDLDQYTSVLNVDDIRIFIRKESIGAFRVSSNSWSTRLVSSQLRHMGDWQREYEVRVQPGTFMRLRARVSRYQQYLMRILAYKWLSVRRDLQ